MNINILPGLKGLEISQDSKVVALKGQTTAKAWKKAPINKIQQACLEEGVDWL